MGSNSRAVSVEFHFNSYPNSLWEVKENLAIEAFLNLHPRFVLFDIISLRPGIHSDKKKRSNKMP